MFNNVQTVTAEIHSFKHLNSHKPWLLPFASLGNLSNTCLYFFSLFFFLFFLTAQDEEETFSHVDTHFVSLFVKAWGDGEAGRRTVMVMLQETIKLNNSKVNATLKEMYPYGIPRGPWQWWGFIPVSVFPSLYVCHSLCHPLSLSPWCLSASLSNFYLPLSLSSSVSVSDCLSSSLSVSVLLSVIFLFLSVSDNLFVSGSLCFCLCLCISPVLLYPSVSASLCVSFSIRLSLSFPFCPDLSLSFSPPPTLFLSDSLSPHHYLYVCWLSFSVRLSFSVSQSVCLCLSLCVNQPLPVSLSLSATIILCLSLNGCLFVPVCAWLPLPPCLCLHLFLPVSVCPFLCMPF